MANVRKIKEVEDEYIWFLERQLQFLRKKLMSYAVEIEYYQTKLDQLKKRRIQDEDEQT
jgi:uncharacterized protein YlxW (UPF0749 family)